MKKVIWGMLVEKFKDEVTLRDFLVGTIVDLITIVACIIFVLIAKAIFF